MASLETYVIAYYGASNPFPQKIMGWSDHIFDQQLVRVPSKEYLTANTCVTYGLLPQIRLTTNSSQCTIVPTVPEALEIA